MAGTPGAAGPGAPFPQWSVSTEDWQVAEVTNAGSKAIAEATVFPNKLIFFTSQAAADAYARSKGQTPINDSSIPGLKQANSAANTIGQAAKDAASLGSWTLGGISGTNLVIRGLKIIVGGILLLIGLAHITGADNTVMNAARKAPVIV